MFAKPARSIAASLLLSALVAVSAAAGAEEPETVPDVAPADDGIVDLEAWWSRRTARSRHVEGSSGGNVLTSWARCPAPRRMEWMSDDVEAVIADAKVVISSPAVVVDADIGIFRAWHCCHRCCGRATTREAATARDGSPELYARWEVLKARYMGRDRGVEKRRPLLAAQELYEAALRKSGLRMGGVVGPVVAKARKAAGVPLVDTTVRLEVEDPKGVLKELNESDLADRECFAGTLDRIETDLDKMRARANAWAVGDIEGLQALPWENHYATCQDAVTGSALARRLGIDDLPRRAKEAWLSNVEQALADHSSSFALLPMHQLLGDDGMLATLAARGYAIESP